MSIRRLRETDLEWTVAFVETRGWCDGDDGRPRRIRFFMVLEGEQLVGLETLGTIPTEAEFLEMFERCQATPDLGQPRRPTRIRSGPSELTTALRQVEGLVHEALSADELAAINRWANGLLPEGEELSGRGTYLDWGNDPEQVERFFELSARLLSVRPWAKVTCDDTHVVLQVTEPEPAELTVAVPACYHGSGRIILFDSERDFFRDLLANGPRSRPGVVRQPRRVEVTFTRAADLDPHVRKEILAQGWPVERLMGYPQILAQDEGGSWVGPCTADLTQAERAVAGLIQLNVQPISLEKAMDLPWGYEASFWIERGQRRERVAGRVSSQSVRNTIGRPRRARVSSSHLSFPRVEGPLPIAHGGGTEEEVAQFLETILREFEASDAGRSLGHPAGGVRRMAAWAATVNRRALDDVEGVVLYRALSFVSSEEARREDALALVAELRAFWGWAACHEELPLAQRCVAFLNAASDAELVDALWHPNGMDR